MQLKLLDEHSLGIWNSHKTRVLWLNPSVQKETFRSLSISLFWGLHLLQHTHLCTHLKHPILIYSESEDKPLAVK